MDDLVRQQLQEAVNEFSGAIDDVAWFKIRDVSCAEGTAHIDLELDTKPFVKGASGLPVQQRERIDIAIGPEFPWIPPQASVKHWRWCGFTHVLYGRHLCLYLDVSTEWDPSQPVENYINRLSEWFSDAIGGKFDPSAALFHPVGGVPHRTPGAPTIVVNIPLRLDQEGIRFQRMQLRDRSPNCIDVVSWNRKPKLANRRAALLVVLPEMLPIGAGSRLSDLADIVVLQQSNGARKRLLKKLSDMAKGLGTKEPLQIIIAVPHPTNTGQGRFHLIACHIESENIQECLTAVLGRKPDKSHPPSEPELVWLYVDDLRDGISVRRDADQPLQQYRGLNVQLWGCGALGSWIGELLARAGIAQITLRDPGYVTQGLVIRQNYREMDVGKTKVEALADRIRSIDNAIEVHAVAGICQPSIRNDLDGDLIIDATVSTSVATAIEWAQSDGRIRVPVVQVSTDSESASLGIVTVCHPAAGTTTNDIDEALHQRVQNEPVLSPFRQLWNPDEPPPIIPVLGCSVPTFRGSGADLVTIASESLNLAANLLSRRISGGHLFSRTSGNYSTLPLTSVTIETE